MRRSLTALLVTLLLASSAPVASAQQGDAAYFEDFDGLQRVIARAWMAPVVYSSSSSHQTIEINEAGTPVVISETFSTPAATPEPQAGVGMFAVLVYLFDNDQNAAIGFDRIDAEFKETRRRDPRAPFTNDLPLDGVGDQAKGYIGDLSQGDVTATYAFATVQDGPFVYSMTSMTAGIDAPTLIRETAETLVRQPMNRMTEQYDPAGASRGGLWSKLDSIHPDVPEGSTVTDLIIYPAPEATPDAAHPEAPRLDLDNPQGIAGLATLDQRTYTLPGNATPIPNAPGIFRIDTWILTFDSEEDADVAYGALGNTLIEPFIIVNGGAGGSGPSTRWSSFGGYIENRSLPPGKSTVFIRQDGTVLAGVAVYAIEEDPAPIAENIANELIDSGFPKSGDLLLHGLVPGASPDATATPDN